MGKLHKGRLKNLPNGLWSDGNNLYLRVRGNSKSWVYRYAKQGHVYEIGLGTYKLIDIETARRKAIELGLSRLDGVSPAEVKRQQKLATAKQAECTIAVLTEDALKWWQSTRGVKDKTIKEYRSRLERLTSIQTTPLECITHKELATELIPLANTTRGTAMNGLKAVFTYAKLKGLINSTALVDDKEQLSIYLPKDTRETVHRASVSWKDVPQVYAKLSANPSHIERAVMFVILHALRISEAISLQSEDVDWESKTATVRGTKTNKEFTFPLVEQCLPWINPLPFNCSQSGCIKALKRITPATLHGFRASFSTWCADHRKDSEIRELCLQHVVGNKVASAYQRSDLLDHRRLLLQEWADYVTGSSSGG